MRCLALAQAWQDAGGQATFAMASELIAITAHLEAEGMHVVGFDVRAGRADDSRKAVRLAHELGAPWVVLDGYHFTSDYQREVKESGLDLLFIDDNGDGDHYYADIILNQNLHAHENLYVNREPYTRLLLNTRYVLLRHEFLKWHEWKREIQDVARKVLVTVGGGDPDNLTLKVVQALQQVNLDGLETVAVVGASNSRYQEIQGWARASRFPIRLESNARNMAELIAWADVAVSGGGSTCWEFAFMGLPSITMILADNQEPISEQLEAKGAAVNLGRLKEINLSIIARALERLMTDTAERSAMSRNGKELVDGKGAARVIQHLTRSRKLTLRAVHEEDCKLLWEWANDPEVRVLAFNSSPVLWEAHRQWFDDKLHDPDCLIFIGLDDKCVPVGQIRFDGLSKEEAEIDVSIDRNRRAMGYGTVLINVAVEEVFGHTQIQRVHAFIKSHNHTSIKAFEMARFMKMGVETATGKEALHYVRVRNNE